MRFLIALVAAIALALSVQPVMAQGAEEQPSYWEIARKLQCPVCEGQSVAESRAQIAQDMQQVIKTKMAAGESEAEIMQFFVDRYGPGVLREPPRTGFYSAVWWVPGLALLFGAAVIYGIVRRRQPGAAEDEPEAIPPVPEEELERYRQRLRGMEKRGS